MGHQMQNRPAALDAAGFDFGGVHHVALVCSDMARTVEFYSGLLGLPLVKTVALPEGGGQHFFFDIGNGDTLAFFWFPDAPPPAPGIAAPHGFPTDLDLLSAVGSMNHLAFSVPAERFDDQVALLDARGIERSEVLNHDDSEWGVAAGPDEPGVYVRSVYFFDPDRILLELAAWTRDFTDADVAHTPARPRAVTG